MHCRADRRGGGFRRCGLVSQRLDPSAGAGRQRGGVDSGHGLRQHPARRTADATGRAAGPGTSSVAGRGAVRGAGLFANGSPSAQRLGGRNAEDYLPGLRPSRPRAVDRSGSGPARRSPPAGKRPAGGSATDRPAHATGTPHAAAIAAGTGSGCRFSEPDGDAAGRSQRQPPECRAARAADSPCRACRAGTSSPAASPDGPGAASAAAPGHAGPTERPGAQAGRRAFATSANGHDPIPRSATGPGTTSGAASKPPRSDAAAEHLAPSGGTHQRLASAASHGRPCQCPEAGSRRRTSRPGTSSGWGDSSPPGTGPSDTRSSPAASSPDGKPRRCRFRSDCPPQRKPHAAVAIPLPQHAGSAKPAGRPGCSACRAGRRGRRPDQSGGPSSRFAWPKHSSPQRDQRPSDSPDRNAGRCGSRARTGPGGGNCFGGYAKNPRGCCAAG